MWCVFITAVPITKLFACGRRESLDLSCFLQPYVTPHLASERAIVANFFCGGGGRRAREPQKTDDVRSAGSKASLADVGLMVPSHERGFQ